MTLDEIRTECREQARDLALIDADRLWSDSEMNRYINRVYTEIARRTHCIRDSRTPATCLISLTPIDYTTYTVGELDYIWANDAASPLYQLDVAPYVLDLHRSILDVYDVKLMTAQTRLTAVTAKKWMVTTGWEQVISTPTEYALDLQVRSLAVNFRSASADTIQLSVARLPVTDLSADTDEPEFKEDYQLLMIDGILAQMYNKQDAETIDLAKASSYKGQHEQNIDDIKFEQFKLHDRLKVNYPMPGQL